jgi:adenine-specific DNA-methyltransferase
MNTFKNGLYRLLEKDSRLWNDETKDLNETLLKDLIDKLDEKLVELFLSDKEIKENFFIKIKDVYVLKQNDLKFFIDENKLDNSYTQYQNKIGLRIGDKLLSERNEVVLGWPFKDCVLEGGMTKEDQKRNEIFFNEILANDEIDRLEDPKALVNWKRYTPEGEEKVKELKRDKNGIIRENIIIKGNNLLALYSLEDQFTGKVKLIYIDPPYNRDEDGFYNDSFRHSTWLTFLKNRLEIACKLLSNKGAIFISIDDNEMAYLKILCDEIFGRDNFMAQIAYERSGVSGLGQGGDFLVNTHESILCYKKSEFKVNNNSGEAPFTYEDMKRYNKIFLDAGKRVEVDRFIAPSTKEPVIIYKHEGEKIDSISLKNFGERQKDIETKYTQSFKRVFRNTSVQEEN